VTYLFGGASRGVLETFAWSNVLLAFDYDGTLAPIVASPGHAVMRMLTRRLLSRLSRLYPCVVISGRARADALARLRGIGIHQVVGNHGAELRGGTQGFQHQTREWMPTLRRRLRGTQGVVLEDKKLSVTVHFRHARRKSHTRAAIVETARSLKNVRTVDGKFVVNFVVPEAPHKGSALDRERSQFGCDSMIYVGDDETDEDVFRLDSSQLLSIRVGRARASSASHYIRNQQEIDRLLGRLVELRGGR
jgi:trehalose 6-phosphate phosphatase